jgi:sucrose-6-phosphate hydrolase SacC (GH32 family)
VAVYPDKLGACWSGSGVVDWKNTTELQTGEEPPLVLAYTSAGSWGQSLVYSNDRGRTWTKYKGNPVLEKLVDNNRDPQVFWHEPTTKWIMVLYVRRGQAHFFKSDDMKTWTPTSVVALEGFHECPDMFMLPVDGDRKNYKWVIYDGTFHYWIGDFDGERFQPQTEALRCEFGRNFHAAQSWETPDGRRVQIGWMNGGKYPGMPFNQQMTFPSELTLRTTADGVRLFVYPNEAIQSLHTKSFSLENHVLKPGENPLAGISGELFDVEMVIETGDATEFGLRLRETAVAYSKNQITSAGAKAEVSPIDGLIKLRILVDRTSIETFVNDGQVALPCCVVPKNLETGLDLYAKGGEATIRSLRATKLKSCWESRDTQNRKTDVRFDGEAAGLGAPSVTAGEFLSDSLDVTGAADFGSPDVSGDNVTISGGATPTVATMNVSGGTVNTNAGAPVAISVSDSIALPDLAASLTGRGTLVAQAANPKPVVPNELKAVTLKTSPAHGLKDQQWNRQDPSNILKIGSSPTCSYGPSGLSLTARPKHFRPVRFSSLYGP